MRLTAIAAQDLGQFRSPLRASAKLSWRWPHLIAPRSPLPTCPMSRAPVSASGIGIWDWLLPPVWRGICAAAATPHPRGFRSLCRNPLAPRRVGRVRRNNRNTQNCFHSKQRKLLGRGRVQSDSQSPEGGRFWPPCGTGTECEGQQRGVHDPFAPPLANDRSLREAAGRFRREHPALAYSGAAECPEDALICVRPNGIVGEGLLILIRSRENRQQLGKR
jgi:hypothetical protein